MISDKPLLSLDDIQGIYVPDYGRPDMEEIGRKLGLESLFQSDGKVRGFTKKDYSYMAVLRKREIVLNLISQIVERSEPISRTMQAGLYSSEGKEWMRTNRLILFGMYMATDMGSKSWSVDFHDLRQMSGNLRMETMRALFGSDKLRLVTNYERQTGETTFETYKANKGELTENEYDAVRSYWPNPSDLASAQLAIARLPDRNGIAESDRMAMAKLIGALGERVPQEVQSQQPHSMWLLAESLIMTAKVFSYEAPKILR